MKITLPVHHFPPRYSAGAELYTLRLARWLQAHGHAVEVVTVEAIDRGAPDRLDETADIYQGVPVRRLSFNLIAAPERQRWNYDNDLLGAWFAGYLRAAQPDLVHFQAGYLLGVAPLRAAIDAGIPTVLTLHDYWFLCPRLTLQRSDGALCQGMPDDPAVCAWCRCAEQRPVRLADQVSGGLAGRAARAFALREERRVIADRRATVLPALGLPDAVIAPSRFLAAQFAPFVPADRLIVSRYGLDLAPYAAAARRGDGGPIRIGFTGQIAPHKGVHVLVEAFTRLRPARRPVELHIYGGLDIYPDYVATLRRIACGDPRVHLHGRFENRRAPEILAGFDLAVVPSVWYENSPLAIMEAHAAGTPVVTAALGGMPELVRDSEDGLLFRAGDARDLARQLQRVIDEPELLPRLRAGVRPPRSIDEEMGHLLGVYERVLQRAVALLIG
jgi:glycosyltransferase involved in cell wall biosynthesis